MEQSHEGRERKKKEEEGKPFCRLARSIPSRSRPPGCHQANRRVGVAAPIRSNWPFQTRARAPFPNQATSPSPTSISSLYTPPHAHTSLHSHRNPPREARGDRSCRGHEGAVWCVLRARGGGRRGGCAGGEEEGGAAGAERDGEAAVAVAGGPVADAGGVGAARVRAAGAEGRDAGLLRQQLHRRGRLRPRLQGLPRRQAPPRPPPPARRRQVPRHRRPAGPPRVAGGGGVPRDVEPSASGEAGRLLLPGRPPHARLRVHGQGQPRAPSLQESAVELAVVDAGEDRRGRGQGARVLARGRHAGDLPRLQGLQHPARIGLHGEALGLWPGQGGPTGRRHPRHHPRHGHPRLRCPRVHPHWAFDGEERRVQLRGGAAGAADGAAERGQAAARAGAAPGGLGAAVPAPAGEAGPGDGPQPGGQLLAQGGAQGRHGRLPLPAQRPQVAPPHARRRRRPRAAAPHARRRALGPLRLHRPLAAARRRRRRRRRGGGGGEEEVPCVGRARREDAAEGGQPVRELRGGARARAGRLADAEQRQGGVTSAVTVNRPNDQWTRRSSCLRGCACLLFFFEIVQSVYKCVHGGYVT